MPGAGGALSSDGPEPVSFGSFAGRIGADFFFLLRFLLFFFFAISRSTKERSMG
jgi:hypothetical protein